MPNTLNKTLLMRMLYFLKLTREIETRIERKLYRQGKIVGGVYVGRGQEAITVGSCIQLEKDDCVCPSHRDMGAFLIRGFSPHSIFAQYMGRKTGTTGGKDGNLHMGDLKKNTIAFTSMLGDTIPVAAGISLSFKMRQQSRVVLCFFGEGASSRGDFHEGLNMAAVLKVPVIYICNNNQYAYSTPLEKQMVVPDVALKASAYGIPGVTVDGNDVFAVYEATRMAINRARQGNGPSLIECKTFRMSGHSAHDDMSYVAPELLKQWEGKDPILRLEQHLKENSIGTDSEIRQLDAQVIQETDAGLALAEKDPFPDPQETLEKVYASPLPNVASNK
jgi:TPP-dependent pyruvate/acetoin dehydrogenase alpha subunit